MTPLLKAEIFEFYVREMVSELRNRFGQVDIGHLNFELDVTGQTNTGELLIEFKLSDGKWNDAVKGGTVQAIFDEFLRRKGWTEQNAPLCLPRVAEKSGFPKVCDSCASSFIDGDNILKCDCHDSPSYGQPVAATFTCDEWNEV